MDWKADPEAIKKKLQAGVEKACIHLVNKVKEKISVDQQYKRYVGEVVTYKGLNPSAPGDPPHLITGKLRASIAYELTSDKLGGKVGSAYTIARYLELGTSHMAARPFLRSTLNQEAAKINQFLKGDA